MIPQELSLRTLSWGMPSPTIGLLFQNKEVKKGCTFTFAKCEHWESNPCHPDIYSTSLLCGRREGRTLTSFKTNGFQIRIRRQLSDGPTKMLSRWDSNPQCSPHRVLDFKSNAFQPFSPLDIVQMKGFEPLRLSTLVPKTSVATNYTTSAYTSNGYSFQL